eukprot:1072757-Alexandrium_andersonii.AAC.1
MDPGLTPAPSEPSQPTRGCRRVRQDMDPALLLEGKQKACYLSPSRPGDVAMMVRMPRCVGPDQLD